MGDNATAQMQEALWRRQLAAIDRRLSAIEDDIRRDGPGNADPAQLLAIIGDWRKLVDAGARLGLLELSEAP